MQFIRWRLFIERAQSLVAIGALLTNISTQKTSEVTGQMNCLLFVALTHTHNILLFGYYVPVEYSCQ